MRINKNTSIKFIPINREYDGHGFENYLEEKSLEGWMIKDMVCGFTVFKKTEPQKYKFLVDIFTESDKDEYIQYCENKGWKYLIQHDIFFIFYAKDQDVTPIKPDNKVVFEKAKKLMKTNLLCNIFLILLIIFNLYNSEKKGYGFISEVSANSTLYIIISLILIIIYAIITTIKDGLWYIQSSRALKLGKNIKYQTLKEFKIKNIFLQLYICILFLMIISFIGVMGNDRDYLYLAILVFIFIISISRLIIIMLKEYKKISSILVVLICAVGIFISTQIILSGKEMINYVRDESKTPIMSINDFIDTNIKREDLYFESSQSFLATSYRYSYNDTEINDDSDAYFTYEICKSNYDWIIDKTFQTYLKRYNYNEYEVVKDNRWNAIEVYKNKQDSSGYLIKYKDRVIAVSGNIDFSKENIRFIKDKCLNW